MEVSGRCSRCGCVDPEVLVLLGGRHSFGFANYLRGAFELIVSTLNACLK